jgi:hypothetical protein
MTVGLMVGSTSTTVIDGGELTQIFDLPTKLHSEHGDVVGTELLVCVLHSRAKFVQSCIVADPRSKVALDQLFHLCPWALEKEKDKWFSVGISKGG